MSRSLFIFILAVDLVLCPLISYIRLTNKRNTMEWKDKDTISLQWCVLDVKQQLKDRGKKEKLNVEECRAVLGRCLHRHDATMGLSWDIMDIHIDDILEERNKI
mgnify:CR=1 FL=1